MTELARHGKLPPVIEEVLIVLFHHFRKTGQRRYWEVDGEDQQRLLADHENRDLYEIVRYGGKFKILLSGVGINYIRPIYQRYLDEHGNEEGLLPASVHPSVEIDPAFVPALPPRVTPQRLLDLIRDEIGNSDLTEKEKTALRRKVNGLWRSPQFSLILEKALDSAKIV